MPYTNEESAARANHGASGRESGVGRSSKTRAWRRPIFILLAIVLLVPGVEGAAENLRNAAYFIDRAVVLKPSVHDVEERIHISREIDPDRMESSAMQQHVAFLEGEGEAQGDFQDESYKRLRAETRLVYAELASTRGQAYEVRRSLELLRKLVDLSNTLYATGKIDQAQALRTQIEYEKLSENLLEIEKREKIFSIRLNVLTGDAAENIVPPLEPLREDQPPFAIEELAEGYKSEQVLALFTQWASAGSSDTSREQQHLGSVEIEANAFLSAARVKLETLLLQARHYRTTLIPRAEQAYSAQLEGYKTGKVDLPALLQGLVELADMRMEYQSLLGELQVTRARVEEATGRTLDPDSPADVQEMHHGMHQDSEKDDNNDK